MGLQGRIEIDHEVSFGMITLGFYRVPIFPNQGIKFQNSGTIIFKGPCHIGNASCISVGQKGKLIFGRDFNATCQFKCICHNSIDFGARCLIGWDSIFMDTDWHSLTKINNGGGYTKGYGKIEIGHDCWFANGCRVYKNSIVPNYITISANTVISCCVDVPEYSIIGNRQTLEVKKSGYWHNMDSDYINYRGNL